MILDFSGTRALVTGGTRGIGRAIVRALGSGGARIAINYKSRGGPAEELGRELGDRHVEHMLLRADVTQERAVGTMIKRVGESWGGLDLLVINHGIWEHAPIGEMSLADWRDTINNNLTGPFILVKEALALLDPEEGRERRDAGTPKRIIFIASTAGVRGEKEYGHYAASKGGLVAFMKTLAVELGPRGITVNAVAPGWIETDMTAEHLDRNGVREKILEGIPLGRTGEPDDVAAAVAFLASRQASWISGETLVVNGGSPL